MTINHSWEEDLGTAEEVLAALKDMKVELSRQTRTNNSGRINYQNGYRDALVELREKVEALRCTENNQLDRMQNVTLAAVLSLLTPKP